MAKECTSKESCISNLLLMSERASRVFTESTVNLSLALKNPAKRYTGLCHVEPSEKPNDTCIHKLSLRSDRSIIITHINIACYAISQVKNRLTINDIFSLLK